MPGPLKSREVATRQQSCGAEQSKPIKTRERRTAFSRSSSLRVRTVSASVAVSSEEGEKALQIVEAKLRTRATTRRKKIIRDFEHLQAAIASARVRLSLA